MNREELKYANELQDKIYRLTEGVANLKDNLESQWLESTSFSKVKLTEEEMIAILARAENTLAELTAEFEAFGSKEKETPYSSSAERLLDIIENVSRKEATKIFNAK